MLTIVLTTQKGGSGKSTLAIGLAFAAMQAGHTVRLMETDTQGTLSNWQARRSDAGTIVETVYNAREIEQRLQSLERSGVTLTIIDTPGGINAATTEAIRYADLCLIPARPSIADIEATASTLHVIRAWRKPFAFVLNQTPIRGHRRLLQTNSGSQRHRSRGRPQKHRGIDFGRYRKFDDDRQFIDGRQSVLFADIQLGLDPLPEPANFLGRFTGRGEFGHR